MQDFAAFQALLYSARIVRQGRFIAAMNSAQLLKLIQKGTGFRGTGDPSCCASQTCLHVRRHVSIVV